MSVSFQQKSSLSQQFSSQPTKFFISRVLQIINNLGIELGLTPIQIITWQILLYLSNGQNSFPCSYSSIARESSKLDKFNKAQFDKKDSPFPCPLDQKGERRVKSLDEAQFLIGISLFSWISGFGRNGFSTVVIEPSWKIISLVLLNCDNNPDFPKHPNIVLREECAKFAQLLLQSATPHSKKSPDQKNLEKCAKRQSYFQKLLSQSSSPSLTLQEAIDGLESSSQFLQNANRQFRHWELVVLNVSTAHQNFSDFIDALTIQERTTGGGSVEDVHALNKDSEFIDALAETQNFELSNDPDFDPKNGVVFTEEFSDQNNPISKELKGVIDDPFYEKEIVDKYTTYENQFSSLLQNQENNFSDQNTPKMTPMEEAENMVEVFEKMGVNHFQITLYKPIGVYPNGKEEKVAEDNFDYSPQELKKELPNLEKRNETGLNLGIHPVLPKDSNFKLILLDDLTKEFFEKLKKYGFWGQQTSEKSFHLWLEIEGANENQFQSIKRRLKAKYGGDPSASYSKICGSLNWKLKYGSNPPRIQKMKLEVDAENRVANEAELLADGIIEKEEEKVENPPPCVSKRGKGFGEGKKWPDYRISLTGAPLKEDGTPDRSVADFRWCLYAVKRMGWTDENEVARKLMEVSQRAKDGGWNYAIKTVEKVILKRSI